MKWKFDLRLWEPRQQMPKESEVRADRDGCRHDWTNWADPVETTMKVSTSMLSSHMEDRDMLVQHRRCIKCNMAERRFL